MVHMMCTGRMIVPVTRQSDLPASPTHIAHLPHFGTNTMTIEDYRNYLCRLPLSVHTRRNYLLRVKRYLEWLEGSPDAARALTDATERDFAVRDYRTWLLQKGSSCNTVNAMLAAIDNFYIWSGLGPVKIKRQELPRQAPRALEPEEQRRFLKAVAGSKSARNRAIAMLMLHCGLRISEVAGLNNSDVVLTARKRELTVRCGKNSKRRVIPINKDAAEALQQYLSAHRIGEGEVPLFTSQKGTRISPPAIDHLIRQLGREAGVLLSSHRLRHVCLTRLVRAGVDVVTVAEIAGHSRLETTRRYSLPTADIMMSAVEKITYAASP